MLLLTAARGNQARRLVPKLLSARIPFRACVQSAASAAALRELGVTDIVVGDLCSEDIRRRATRGISTIYHVGPACHPQEREMGLSMIESARAEGVEHFIFSSVLHSIVTDLVQHEIKRDIEERLVSSGLNYTILQPTNFMLPLKLRSAFQERIFRLSWSLDRRQSMVDLGDLADVIITVIRESGRHFGATYELAAPGQFTAYEIGEIIAQVADGKISVEQIPPETYLEMVFGKFDHGQFRHRIDVHSSITRYYGSHDFIGNPNVLTWLLGRTPTTFEQFVRSEFSAFRSTHEIHA